MIPDSPSPVQHPSRILPALLRLPMPGSTTEAASVWKELRNQAKIDTLSFSTKPWRRLCRHGFGTRFDWAAVPPLPPLPEKDDANDAGISKVTSFRLSRWRADATLVHLQSHRRWSFPRRGDLPRERR